MDKIASATELQAELRKLLAYAQTPNPSRTVLARDLVTLGTRVGGLPPEFLENIQKKKDEAKDKDDKKDDKD